MTHEHDNREEPEDAEVVDGLPVLADQGPAPASAPEPAGGLAVPVAARQVAALTAGGFLAGCATVALAHRHKTRKLVKRRASRPRSGPVGEILASNSFLVDVHLIRRD